MILPLPERMKLHAEFMCATITGLLPKLPLIDQTGEHGIKVPDKVVYNQEVMDSCRALADAALELFEKRWEEEIKAEDERRTWEEAIKLSLTDYSNSSCWLIEQMKKKIDLLK